LRFWHMNDGDETQRSGDQQADRLVRIESALMHLSHDVEAMHEAIISQQREIDGLRRTLERLQSILEREVGLTPEVRDPAAERPPHY
jgi:uncharacterized coiled-coil protein SlyX